MTKILFALSSLLLCATARAQWVEETYSLKAGTTAIWLSHDCTGQAMERILAGYDDIDEIWRWNPLGSTVQFVEAPSAPIAPDSNWAVWRRGDPANSTLGRLTGNSAYLIVVKATATPFTLKLVGKPLLPVYRFASTGLNFLGFPAKATIPGPTFDSFFSYSAALKSNPSVTWYNGGALSDIAPKNPLLISTTNLRNYSINRGQAYWVKSAVYADYYGPLQVTVNGPDDLDYGKTLNTITLRVKNVTDPLKAASVTARFALTDSGAPGDFTAPAVGRVPVRVRGPRDAALQFTYSDLAATSLVLAPGESKDLVLDLDRTAMTVAGGSYQAILQMTDSLGQTRIDLPLSATGTSRSGVWIGAAVLDSVNQVETLSGPEFAAPLVNGVPTPNGSVAQGSSVMTSTVTTAAGVSTTVRSLDLAFDSGRMATLDTYGADLKTMALYAPDGSAMPLSGPLPTTVTVAANSAGDYATGQTNLTKVTVVDPATGNTLVEGVDYTVDAASGVIHPIEKQYIESVASLGSLNAGDTVAVRLFAAWDLSWREPGTNWEARSLSLTGAGSATPLAAADFRTGNADLTATNEGAPDGPWTYDAAAGAWRAAGSEHVSYSSLTSPVYAVSTTGIVNLRLKHRYNFEPAYDGGQIWVSINGGAWQTLAAVAFTANSYSAMLSWEYQGSLLNTGGKEAFNGQSAGYNWVRPAAVRVTYSAGSGILPSSSTSRILLTDGGSGYSKPPTVTLTGGSPNATAVAAISGRVTRVTMDENGSGTLYNQPPVVRLSGGGGTGAAATATIDEAGHVTAVTVTDGGSGYSSAPAVQFILQRKGSGATATVTTTKPDDAYRVSRVNLTNPGINYTVPPLVRFTGTTLGSPSANKIAAATATLDGAGHLNTVTVTNGGLYASPPTVEFIDQSGLVVDGTGSGARASAKIVGSVASVTLTSGGGGYTAAPVVTLSAPGEVGGKTASASAAINSAGAVIGLDAIRLAKGVTVSDPASGSVYTSGLDYILGLDELGKDTLTRVFNGNTPRMPNLVTVTGPFGNSAQVDFGGAAVALNPTAGYFPASARLTLSSSGPAVAGTANGSVTSTVTSTRKLVTLNGVSHQVTERVSTGDGASAPSQFPLRLILHADSGGAMTLLQQVYLGQRDEIPYAGTTEAGVARLVTSAGPTTPGKLGRASSANFPRGGSWTATGSLGTSAHFEIDLGHANDAADNPFLHTFHPDHDNWDARYERPLNAGNESYDVVRKVSLTFGSPPAGLTDLTWGATTLGGIYEETFTGLRHEAVHVSGRFMLKQVSTAKSLITNP